MRGGRRRRQGQLQADERIELKEAPPGMRNYWCTIVRENYKMLLGRPGQGVKGADRRKEVIARLGQVLGQGAGGGGVGGGRVERKLSLPISIVSPGKPTLTKGQASDPLLVTKSSIRRRFWADPRRIHHNLHGLHHNLGGIHRNHQEPQGKHPQLQVQQQGTGSMANDIVAELKRDNFAGGQNKIDRQQVLWGSFKEGGRRIWQEETTAPDSGENYISQEVAP